MIEKEKGGYEVESEKGRPMGKYKSKKVALDRLHEIEMFKHMDEAEMDRKAMPGKQMPKKG